METPTRRSGTEIHTPTDWRSASVKCSTCGEIISRGEFSPSTDRYWEKEKLRKVYPAGPDQTPEIQWGGIGWRVTGTLKCRCMRAAESWAIETMGLAEGEPWPEPGDARWKRLGTAVKTMPRPVGLVPMAALT